MEDYFYTGLCRYNWLSISIDTFTNEGLICINKTKNQFNNIKIVSKFVFTTQYSVLLVNIFF